MDLRKPREGLVETETAGMLLFDTAGRLARVDPARGEVRRVVLR